MSSMKTELVIDRADRSEMEFLDEPKFGIGARRSRASLKSNMFGGRSLAKIPPPPAGAGGPTA